MELSQNLKAEWLVFSTYHKSLTTEQRTQKIFSQLDKNARFVYIYSEYIINVEYFWVNLVYELSQRCRSLYEYKYKLQVTSINHNKGGILHCIFNCYLLSDSTNFCPIVIIFIIYQIYFRSIEQDSYLSPRLSSQMLWPINLNFTYFQIKKI